MSKEKLLKKQSSQNTEAKKRCPFDAKLECCDCRLYQSFVGGSGERKCVVIMAGVNA